MDGQDQFVGLVACGISVLDDDFDQLPPHFNQRGPAVLTDEEWLTILPGYEQLPLGFQQICPFLLASLVRHHDWLRATLPPTHPLFLSPLFTTGMMTRFLSVPGFVLGGNAVNHASGLRATGVPPLSVLARRITNVEAKLDAWGDALKSHFDKRVSALEEKMDLLAGQLKTLPDAICRKLTEEFSINGVQALSIERVGAMLNEHFRAHEDRMRPVQLPAPAPVAGPAVPAPVPPVDADVGDGADALPLLLYDGSFHRFPRDFVFPMYVLFLF